VLFGKKKNYGNFLVGFKHFLPWPIKNSSLQIGEKTKVKTLVAAQ